MYAANRFPAPAYGLSPFKEGGLAAKAHAVESAGRHGDDHVIHVNDDELQMLRQQWGEPTINPETGLHEFFKFGKILKVLKTVAPIAAAFIPGVGPLASAALSAGLNAADAAASGQGIGGILKQGVIGGATGYVGGGGLSNLGAKAATTAATNAATSAAAPSLAALGSAAPGAASNFAANAATSAGTSALKDAAINTVADVAQQAAAPRPEAELQPVTPVPTARVAAVPQAPAQPNFWNTDFMNLGVKNKYALPALAVGALAYDLLKKKPKDDEQSAGDFFGPDFAGTPLVSTSSKSGYNRYLAKGGEAAGPMERTDFAVNGPGDGRSDDIPAMLSDGEYVMDAETVAMLGDGSTKAGAKKLDDFRVSIRKHKGAKLAKGKFSAKAKRPEAYMAGGRA